MKMSKLARNTKHVYISCTLNNVCVYVFLQAKEKNIIAKKEGKSHKTKMNGGKRIKIKMKEEQKKC